MKNKITKINILIGAAGSGKSTYIKNNKCNSDLVISSDQMRLEQTGSFAISPNEKILEMMLKNFRQALEKNIYDTIWLDATNLKRRRRQEYYNIAKKYNVKNEINAIVIVKSLKESVKSTETRGYNPINFKSVYNQYLALVVPRLNVDCDNIIVKGPKDLFEKDFKYFNDDNHYSPYHDETISEHIKMCIDNAKLTKNSQLIDIAKYHDLGKYITQNENLKDTKAAELVRSTYGKFCNYMRHENVGALYYLAKYQDEIMKKTEYNLEIMEVILKHMIAHQGISNKTINGSKLNNNELILLHKFAKIDNKSKKTRILEQYRTLLKENFK